MYRAIKIIDRTIIMLLLLMMAMPILAFAAEIATAEIPFTIKNAPGTVIIEAVQDAPLPEQTELEGVSEGKFEIPFSQPGDYYYKIYQKPGTQQGVTYDSTVYSVCISVFVKEDGEMYTVAAVNIEGSSQKAEGIEFENTPSESTVPSESSKPGEPTTPNSSGTPKTGDDSNLSLWFVLTPASLLGLAVCFFMWKKAK